MNSVAFRTVALPRRANNMLLQFSVDQFTDRMEGADMVADEMLTSCVNHQ